MVLGCVAGLEWPIRLSMIILKLPRGCFSCSGCISSISRAIRKHNLFLYLHPRGCYDLIAATPIAASDPIHGLHDFCNHTGANDACTSLSSAGSDHPILLSKVGFASAQEKPRAGESQKRNSLGCNGGGLMWTLLPKADIVCTFDWPRMTQSQTRALKLPMAVRKYFKTAE